jgi:N-hydroxyarylamine O-acetyltransferase
MTPTVPAPLDLAAYLERIEYQGPLQATEATLTRLHRAHATHIPFENLDIFLGVPIRLDRASIQNKLVRSRRGGYCFEQNQLLAAVLEHLGFRVTLLAGRVRYDTQRILPRTHVLLLVEVSGAPWLADVGFGTEGLLDPMPLVPGVPCRQEAWTYRLSEDQGTWVLQADQGSHWLDLYAFTREPQLPIDCEVANYYVSTHPDSRFTRTLVAQKTTPRIRYKLINRELTVNREGVRETREIAEEELLPLLADTFGLHFPSGTRFRAPFPT